MFCVRKSGDHGALRNTHLGLDIEDAATSACRHLTYGPERGAVVVSRELGVLDERVLAYEFFELVARDKVVVFAVDFSRTRCARCVCDAVRAGT